MKEPYNKGDEYEAKIFDILLKRGLIPKGSERAGAGGKADTVFIHANVLYNLEVKNALEVDFGQKILRWSKDKKWHWSEDDDVTQLYTAVGVLDKINEKNIVPIKFNKPNAKITPEDKKLDQNAFEARTDIPFEALVKYYNGKGVFYIQIGNGFGFYHLGADVANLGTQPFVASLSLRLRAKTVHSTQASNYGFYAVIKIKAEPKPPKSKFNLEPLSSKSFPPIKGSTS